MSLSPSKVYMHVQVVCHTSTGSSTNLFSSWDHPIILNYTQHLSHIILNQSIHKHQYWPPTTRSTHFRLLFVHAMILVNLLWSRNEAFKCKTIALDERRPPQKSFNALKQPICWMSIQTFIWFPQLTLLLAVLHVSPLLGNPQSKPSLWSSRADVSFGTCRRLLSSSLCCIALRLSRWISHGSSSDNRDKEGRSCWTACIEFVDIMKVGCSSCSEATWANKDGYFTSVCFWKEQRH